jgi:hypothetical protein
MGLGEQSQDGSGADRFFTSFSTLVAKWTGTHWTFVIVVVLVVASLLTIEVDDTNIAISILLMGCFRTRTTGIPPRCISRAG